MSTDWSVPETDVRDRIRTAIEEGREAVLATVVAVEGSAYRRPGAKMLVERDGSGVGSITAGCLEDEVRALAEDVLAGGEPRVETWDLTGDDDVWGMGVGCNGVVTVLLEPLDDSLAVALDAARDGVGVAATPQTATVVTALDGEHVGERRTYVEGRGFDASDGPAPVWLPEDDVERVVDLAERGESTCLTVEHAREHGGDQTETTEVFVDVIVPPPHLVVFGSGHDVTPVVEAAKRVDFRVTVVGFRGARATAERFPRADAVHASSPARFREEVDVAFDDDTYAVVMSHNFLDDRLAVAELLETEVPYVGLMGPRKRFDEMLVDLREEGVTLSERDRERLYTPVGLDLGGGTPHQIAHGIVAEALAVANDRDPGHLSEREGPIHDRPAGDREGGP